ncbi:endonuclease III domain-containing protein, partial [Campylobacter jejuni]|nr:endonuclease III domain-containing protein [Campylobacter jejuni]
SEQENLYKILGKKCELYELYQIFHALIVAFAKQSFKGQKLSPKGEEWIKILKEDL